MSSEQMVKVPVSIVNLIKESVAISKDAAQLCEKVAAQQQTIDVKAPMVADALIEAGIVDPLDKEATVQLLTDPVASLDIITKLAKQASKPKSLGQPVKVAKDDYDPRFPPPSEADRVFAEKLLGVSL